MDSDSIGIALIVGGAAFVCSGLVFLLPTKGKQSIEDDREQVDRRLSKAREERGELDIRDA